MSYKIAAFTEAAVEKETEKALLINAYGWFPKSQAGFVEVNGQQFFYVKAWLFNKKTLSLFDVYGTKIWHDADTLPA
jgi:hypothetical protein